MTTAEDAHNIADMKYSMFPRSENRREIQGQTLQHSKLINLLEVEQICICVSSKSTTRSRTRWRGFHQREYPQPENLERIRPCQLKMVRIRRTRLLRTRTTESSSRNPVEQGCKYSQLHTNAFHDHDHEHDCHDTSRLQPTRQWVGALSHSHPGLFCTPWVPARHPRYTGPVRGKAVGGPTTRHDTRQTHNKTHLETTCFHNQVLTDT